MGTPRPRPDHKLHSVFPYHCPLHFPKNQIERRRLLIRVRGFVMRLRPHRHPFPPSLPATTEQNLIRVLNVFFFFSLMQVHGMFHIIQLNPQSQLANSFPNSEETILPCFVSSAFPVFPPLFLFFFLCIYL